MSRFLNPVYQSLQPYLPGEQGLQGIRLKLNTNESPFPPSLQVQQAVTEASKLLHLYSDPEGTSLRQALAKRYQVPLESVFLGNGSDEILYLAFLAFCHPKIGVACPEISYGFYPVYAQMVQAPYYGIPMCDDLRLSWQNFLNLQKTILLANPNAPTGYALSLREIEAILQTNRAYPVIIDEAYVDFGAESCLPLLGKYENLLLVQTFSKSRGLAGGRLGFALGHPALIADLQRLRYSFNPYNVNTLTLAAAEAVLAEEHDFQEHCQRIMTTRDQTQARLQGMGFRVTKSLANFVFASPPDRDGLGLSEWLKTQGILVRHFSQSALSCYIRISIGSVPDMDLLLNVLQIRYPSERKELYGQSTPG